MSDDIPEIFEQAIRAGHKYLESLEGNTEAINSGQRPDFSETKVILANYHDWQHFNKQAMEYLEKKARPG